MVYGAVDPTPPILNYRHASSNNKHVPPRLRSAQRVNATVQRRLRAQEAERVGSELRVGGDVAQCSEADQRGNVQPDRGPQAQVQPRRQAAVLEDIDHRVVDERREGAKEELPDVVAEAERGRAYGCGEDVEADAHEDDGRPAEQASGSRAAEDDVASPREQQPHRHEQMRSMAIAMNAIARSEYRSTRSPQRN